VAPTLTLTETAQRLVYTGVGPMAGYSLTIEKSATVLDVRSVVPLALAAGQTWQTMKAELASRLT
jgi:hypothetical protein